MQRADGNVYWDVPETWKSNFIQNVCGGGAMVSGSLKTLRRFGLERGALCLLYNYARGDDPNFNRPSEWTKTTGRKLKAAIRAGREAEKRSNESRAALFRDRANEAGQEALESPWPDGQIETLAAELRREKLPANLPVVRRAIVRTAGKRGILTNPLYYLFLLQGYTGHYEVRLGLKRLAALADCANPKRTLNPETLSRFLRSIGEPAAIIRDTLPELPQPQV